MISVLKMSPKSSFYVLKNSLLRFIYSYIHCSEPDNIYPFSSNTKNANVELGQNIFMI